MTITKTQWIWFALVAGSAGGGFLTASMIEALKPFTNIISAGSGFLGAIVAYFIAKANAPKETK